MTPGIGRCITPVILAVPDRVRRLPIRERVRALSAQAREALRICAVESGVELGPLEKKPNGAPVPFDGHHWSLTHKPAYVGAVISRQAAGIDIEAVKEVSDGLIRKTAGEREWRLAAVDPAEVFFRYWTAKEAVLKAAGSGMAGLSDCRVVEIPDAGHLGLEYGEASYLVEHFFFDGHVASVVKNRLQVDWKLFQKVRDV
ncbi:MAG: 4'-phosphopantetheinyl transferase superfamily protein [Deltaproteobacteria bacterium]|nr:4'-phosphopantetheinyl transferase superfamily protein [Deltaproteobacteria bacterium]